jgi:cobalamin biosynthesis protein CobD/CbiB
MDYFFWGNLFEYFKERRIAGMFFGTLLWLLLLLIAGVILYHIMGQNIVYLLPVGAGLFLLWLVRAFLRARERWRYRYKSRPLSQDDLKKARTRLMKAKH